MLNLGKKTYTALHMPRNHACLRAGAYCNQTCRFTEVICYKTHEVSAMRARLPLLLAQMTVPSAACPRTCVRHQHSDGNLFHVKHWLQRYPPISASQVLDLPRRTHHAT